MTMPSDNEIKDRVFKLLEHYINSKKLRKKNIRLKLREDLSFDSLDTVEFSMNIEDAWDNIFEIYDENFEKWKTVQDIIDCIKEKLR